VTDLDRTCLTAAAVASAAAGLVHAAAAGTHAGDRDLAVLFALCAVAQVGWAAAAVLRPSRRVAAAGVLLNAGALAAWAVSRRTEAVGVPDLTAALLAAVAVAGAVAAVVVRRRLRVPPVLAAVAVAVLVVPAIPAMAASHEHGGADDHGHEAGHDTAQAAGEAADPAHDAEHDTEHDAARFPEAAGAGHEHHDVPERLDHEPTDEQREAARRLIDETEAATTVYADVAAATGAGYLSIGDAASGFEHYVNPAFMADDAELDPARPESLVYEVQADGSLRFTTVMYTLGPGKTMEDVPDIAGNLTVWHTHDNLCFTPGTVRLAGAVVGGRCRPGGVNRPTSPMLHVWVVPNDCGPFAGTDRGQDTGSCVENPGL
jgi:hypothetical protein